MLEKITPLQHMPHAAQSRLAIAFVSSDAIGLGSNGIQRNLNPAFVHRKSR
jgi:hypothetical protein